MEEISKENWRVLVTKDFANSTLNSIMGAKGIPLSYIISEEDGLVIIKPTRLGMKKL